MITIRLINSTWPPQTGQFKSAIVLNYDDWNDYSYRTSFGMFYFDDNGEVHPIGNVKIYSFNNDEARTHQYGTHTRRFLDEQIVSLDSIFCSLGQEVSYYVNLKRLIPSEYMDVLKRLNDIAIFPDIRDRFIKEKGVQASLLRFSGAEKALKEALEIVHQQERLAKDISFSYKIMMPYDIVPAVLRFDFKHSEKLPFRVNALVGKNGTGKTQVLSRLASSLSGFTEQREHGSFVDDRPPVDKVLSISYSAFDQFRKPPKRPLSDRKVFSYVYCGIQSEEGTLSLKQLKDNLKNSYQTVKQRDRVSTWKSILSELMEKEHQETVKLVAEEKFDEIVLSSGQQILICTITELIANIEEESIILFDEPEIHLHPNAISNVMRMFNKLLEQYNSYAIFSTHSPIILQEIPSQYVLVLDRIENTLTVRRPDVECFGNNISDIIFDVFDVSSLESNYKTHLRMLSETLSPDDINGVFGGKLSLNALLFLKNSLREES